MRLLRLVIQLICIFGAFCTFSHALADESTEYLYKLRESSEYPVTHLAKARLQSEETLADKLGIFKTDDIELLKEYEKMGILEFYEENSAVHLAEMPNTSELMTERIYGAVPQGVSYGQIWVDALWKLGLSGRGVRVGVVDSGVSKHSAFSDNLLTGYDYVENDNDPSDEYGHGTQVAGLIASNGDGYRGIAYEAEIVPLRVFDGNGSAASIEVIAKAFYEAVFKFDCNVLNLSFGVTRDPVNNEGSPTFRSVIEAIYSEPEKRNVVIVAAAGNYGITEGSEDSYYYPASCVGVISVGSIDKNNELAPSSRENDMVDVVAPGVNLTLLKYDNPYGFSVASGTSFASPIVAGVVALIKQAEPSLTHSQINDLLCETAYNLGKDGYDISYGYGKIDCEAIAQRLFDGKMYVSPIVKHNGVYNVALYNGYHDLYEATAFIAGYDSKKMMSVTKHDVSIEQFESTVLSFPSVYPEMKLFNLDSKGYMPYYNAVNLEY